MGLSTFGAFHTIISVLAVVAGLVALARHREIGTGTGAGRLYVLGTIASCVTGLFIFRHGSFGPPHALAILTLLVLAVAWFAERRARPGSIARIVAVVGYSLSLFFHVIPGLTETGTRLPAGAPAFTGPEDPTLRAAVGAFFLLFLVGAAIQVLRLRRETAGARQAA